MKKLTIIKLDYTIVLKKECKIKYWVIHLTKVPSIYSIQGFGRLPQDLEEFEARFSTEEACRDYLFKLRWPNGIRCLLFIEWLRS